MPDATMPARPAYDIFRRDRPGWIPEWVGDDWDPHPYAYQTAKKRMPADRFHSLYVQILTEMLSPLLERLGLQAIIDVFIFYRDWEERKQRIAPDLLIAPVVELTPAQMLRSYDLDQEPLPLCVVEVTSASSQVRDRQSKGLLYAALGISEYLLLDIVHPDNPDRLREQIGISLWRLEDGVPQVVTPDAEGYLTLECIGVRLRAEGQRLVAQVVATGELLRTSRELAAALTEAEQSRLAAEQQATAAELARTTAEQQATAAEQRAAAAEAELAQLRAELARLRGEQE